jgi:hypothetical protein
MVAHRFVAVVGARVLPEAWASQVAEVVRFFLARGWGVGSGGARGADQYALEAVVAGGRAACAGSVVFLPGPVGAAPGSALGAFAALGGCVVPGAGAGRAALLGRSARLACVSSGVVAFLWGPSRGSVFTVREAVRAGKPAAVVLAGGGASLPSFAGGRWVPCSVGSVAAFRWVAEAAGPCGPDGGEPEPTALHRIFVVPDGEPVQALMEHVSSLSHGERLWFEQGVLAGDTVFVPHEALSDTPAFLALPRLRRRFRCTAREAAGLAELFLALDASPAVVVWYEGEARRLGVGPVLEEMVRLVVQLALVEEVPSSDALDDAERLGDGVDLVSGNGDVARGAVQSDGDAPLAWHALGAVRCERVVCPACGLAYEADDECLEIPTCPACATPNTWEARQGAGFRALVAEIDGCASLVELATFGKRLYALVLSHDQAGVAWSHYRLRKAALEAAVTLGAPARVLVAEVEAAPARVLPRLGARLYRLQHGGGETAVTAMEWRRVWQAYQARKAALAA